MLQCCIRMVILCQLSCLYCTGAANNNNQGFSQFKYTVYNPKLGQSTVITL